ncbi:glyoxalase/bleomycin resistance/dioxygenase family protein [Hymenobacter busanensis]|uniref:Glyoxalase/bleomycin resistance/dioxygenase family protein n=1 Tax=Hymenobacter busanensis TaxID=2607656 RepID=A0A7L4ZUH3_9BACT|nr:ArsI/CadI family heavy metal resistance metalloenzyme [Hymenobacter busanensis]KAA9339164.1 glyoxalase/bleomycin resistance/dioxygenase family protein [Hymenobacter busanensis]QHJ07074.1 glyoxalase/bleomycin resistance/dioxygenase family protein [Hymenobacter busanensis]
METPVFPRMHVSLYVSDLNATVAFYNAFFGQPAAKIRRGYAKYVLDQPSLIISFVENPARVQSHFGHLGFQVETVAELNVRLAAARAAGLVQREEVGTSCCYAKQDKFWVNDPDGVEWEVYYFHEDAEFNDPRYEADYQQTSNQCCIAPAVSALAADTLVTAPMAFTLADTSTVAECAPSCSPGGVCC